MKTITTLAEIETSTRQFADAHRRLLAALTQIDDALRQVKDRYDSPLRQLLSEEGLEQAALADLIRGAPELFVSPRTYLFHGVKVGLRKSAGAMKCDKPAKVIDRIKALMPERAAELIRTKEEPDKEALAKLTAAELRKLGVSIEAAGDHVVIDPQESEVDSMVDALLKGLRAELAA